MCLSVHRCHTTKADAVSEGKSTAVVATRPDGRIHSFWCESQQSIGHLRSVFYIHNADTTNAAATITTTILATITTTNMFSLSLSFALN